MFNQAVPIAESIAVLGATATVLARWVPTRSRRIVTLVAAGMALVGLILTAAFGMRWQMYPVFAAALIALLFAIPTLRGPREGRHVCRDRPPRSAVVDDRK